MAIRSFSVGPMRSLVRAVGDHLGNLVVLAGPNGAGKSSLLELLRQQRNVIAEPGTEVMFVGPHRTWRATRLNQMAVYGLAVPSFRELLKKDMLPQFQYYVPPGMQWIQGGSRETSSADDAQALVKASLVKLRDKQQKLVAAAWKEQGSRISEGTVPDLFEPFTRLIETLLPHLDGLESMIPIQKTSLATSAEKTWMRSSISISSRRARRPRLHYSSHSSRGKPSCWLHHRRYSPGSFH